MNERRWKSWVPVVITLVLTGLVMILGNAHWCHLHSTILEVILPIAVVLSCCFWTAGAKTSRKAWLRTSLSFLIAVVIQISYLGWLHSDFIATELQSQTHISPIELVSRVVERLAQSDETAQGLATEMGGSLMETEAAKSWEILLPAPGIRLFCNAPEPSVFIKSVFISFDLECNLTLRDLINELGTYKVIHESKTSSVLFYQVRGSRIQVYAHLFWSKVGDASPVLSVDIRLE